MRYEDMNLELDLIDGPHRNRESPKALKVANVGLYNEPSRIMERACKELDKEIQHVYR
jgi:hypothetical protein